MSIQAHLDLDALEQEIDELRPGDAQALIDRVRKLERVREAAVALRTVGDIHSFEMLDAALAAVNESVLDRG